MGMAHFGECPRVPGKKSEICRFADLQTELQRNLQIYGIFLVPRGAIPIVAAAQNHLHPTSFP